MIDYSIVIRGTKPGTKTEDITETKAYGVAQISEILTINEFAKHIAQHGTLYSRDVIQDVLIKMVDCIREGGQSAMDTGLHLTALSALQSGHHRG